MRRSLAPAIGMVLLTAACGSPSFDVRPAETKGPQWFPQVVEFEQNAGPGLSMTTDAEGNPHLAYLEFPEPPPPGETPVIDPLAPVLPAVGHAHLVSDIWSHSEVAQSQAEPPKPLELTADDETAIAVDAEGMHHIAWTEKGQVLYSNDTTGETKPVVVDSVDAAGLSIWAAEDGTPWIAYYELLKGAEGPSTLVRVAHFRGDRWEIQTAAEADASEPFGTGIGVGLDGPLVAYGDATGTMLARQQGSTWQSEVADEGGGLGVSMDLDADGNPHLAYLTPDGQVRHAHSIDGGAWEITDVGAAAGLATTTIAVDADGVHHIAWQRDVDLAYASNAAGDFAEVPLPPATLGGSRPRLAAGAAGVYLAWYSAEGTSLNIATYTDEEPLLAVPSPTAPPGGGGGAPAACAPEGTQLTITAPSGAAGTGFDKDCLAVNAGEAFTVELINDDGLPHNFSIYTDETAAEKLLDGGAGAQGGGTISYDGGPIDKPGDLFFRCDFHSTTMTGTFVVAGK